MAGLTAGDTPGVATAARGGTLIYVSLVLEVMRARPRLVVALAALTQALLWIIVPTLFFAAPPGDLAVVLALGQEFQLGTWLGPPLAFWAAALASRVAGMFGVYVLAQACVVATYLIAFRLGCSIVGVHQAALAVLLMVGISAFALPTPEFGPAVLAMPIWAFALLHYWRAVGEGRRMSWFALAVALGLLLLTTYWGLLLVGVLVALSLAARRGRMALASLSPWLAIAVTLIVLAPHLFWLHHNYGLLLADLPQVSDVAAGGAMARWLRLLAALVLAHAGLVVLVVLASGWPDRAAGAPMVRAPLDRFGKAFAYATAAAPVVLGTAVAAWLGRDSIMSEAGLLLVPAALALVVLGGDRIPVHRQRILAYAWFGLLLVPPLATAAATLVTPWLGIDLRATQPAAAMGRYFAETFERRTGTPLAVVAGEPRLAALVAAAAPSRPGLFLDAQPDRTPWTGMDDVRRKGAVVVWTATSTAGTPPPDIRARFPELRPEVPRIFARPVDGRLPPVRIGWAVIRPAP